MTDPARPPELTIGDRRVGPDHPPFIVAELSANHNGSREHALAIIDAAAEAGAHAIKLQTYTADTITLDAPGPEFQIRAGPWAGRSLHELYASAHTPWDWHAALFERARHRGLIAFSSPFDFTAVDFLEQFEPAAYKIASFEIVDLPLIEYAARKGRPLIISTGMASSAEIAEAVAAARGAGCRDLCLLHCTSAYPAPPEDADLRTMVGWIERYGVIPGLSDHTNGTTVAVAAVALGACVIEKHLTLRRADGGPDAAFSLEPDELRALVSDTRTAWRALGGVRHEPKPSEAAQRPFRRSLYVAQDMRAGDVFTGANVRSVRPAFGLPPKHLEEVLGRRAARDVARGTPLSWELVE